MSMNENQKRQKAEAMRLAEHHNKNSTVDGSRSGNGDTADEGYKREQSERKNNPGMYDKQGYAKVK